VNVNRPIGDGPAVYFDPTDAGDLRALAGYLSIVEDWLLHTSDDVLDELARFAFRAVYHPRDGVDALVDHLGHASVALHRHATALGEPR